MPLSSACCCCLLFLSADASSPLAAAQRFKGSKVKAMTAGFTKAANLENATVNPPITTVPVARPRRSDRIKGGTAE